MSARGFLESGAKVYISSRKARVCDDVARQLSSVGQCVSIPGNVSTAAGCAALAKQIQARENCLHILVNNAGAAWGETMAAYPESGWDKVINTNVKSVFFLTRELLPLLERAATPPTPRA